jgi:hypothetical protein
MHSVLASSLWHSFGGLSFCGELKFGEQLFSVGVVVQRAKQVTSLKA